MVSRIYKDSLQFNKKKKKNPIKNAQKLLTGDSQKMKFKWPINRKKPNSLDPPALRKMQKNPEDMMRIMDENLRN